MYRNNQTAGDTSFKSGFGRICGDSFFGRRGGGKAAWMQHFGDLMNNRVPVNIEEDDNAYYLHLSAAGLTKEVISLSVKKDVLSVSYSAPETDEKKEQFSHREFSTGSFERLFQLNGNVLTDQISAAYENGILKVTLPKNPETNKPEQHVTVS